MVGKKLQKLMASVLGHYQKLDFTLEWTLPISFCGGSSTGLGILASGAIRFAAVVAVVLLLLPGNLLQDFIQFNRINAVHVDQCFALLLVVQ